jgi:alpha-beta hydrolase superfamily lysophospholipase
MPSRRIMNVVATASALVMALFVDARIASAATAGFAASACPAAVADVADCHVGRDDNGAWVLAAIPRSWNRQLIVHAHGGPRLSTPAPADSAEDLARFGIMVRMGYAWVGSTYRRAGYGVRMAAADVEASRRMFEAEWGRAERTLLHGQSWGGNIAAKLAELHALDDEGRARYDGVLITNGVLTGGTRAYGFRADLRAVYQYYCRNHPLPDEPQYPVWQGLPADASMTREALQRRVDDCTGLGLDPAKRSQEQAARLADILAVTGVREPQLLAHLAWGTFHFQDLVHRRLGGRNPFDNAETRYRGSRDDDALNAGVERFKADPVALARLAYDADLSGLIVLPTLTVHAMDDPVVAASAQAAYAATVQAAGRSALLVQVQTDEADHSRLGDATLETALRALGTWLDEGQRPAAAAMQRDCLAREDDASACRFRR